MVTKTFGALLVLVMSAGSLATAAPAQVNINVNIGQPPPVVVAVAPTMLLMPEPQMYVAVGVPYDIYFVSGRYYYLHGDHWFWGPAYDGPWTFVAVEKLPPGFRKYKVKQLHDFREKEYVVYKTKGPKYSRTYFVATESSRPARGRGHNKH